jgi:hypothetical protein
MKKVGLRLKVDSSKLDESYIVATTYRQFLRESLYCIRKREPQTPDYDCPSWAYKEADRIGYNRAIQEVLNLLDINGDLPTHV